MCEGRHLRLEKLLCDTRSVHAGVVSFGNLPLPLPGQDVEWQVGPESIGLKRWMSLSVCK